MFFNYFNSFRLKKPNFLGLDITSSAVKLIELRECSNGQRVETFGIVPLPPNAITENLIHQPEAVTLAISNLLRQTKPSARTVAVAINSSSVITKTIQVESALSESEIENQIMLQEAPRLLPFPIEEVSLDYEIIGPNKFDSKLLDVLIGASRSENVTERVRTIEAAGLEVKIVDVESYAMERACQLCCRQLPNEGYDRTIAVIDIGSMLTKITVLHNLETVYYREELFGSRNLTEAIQHHYGLTYAEAGLAKKRGTQAPDYITEVLEPFRQSLVPLIRRSLQFFFSASRFDQVDHILLAGGGALTQGLTKVLNEQIGISTSIANPFIEMDTAERVDKELLAADSPTLMIACGLAMRSFDTWQR